MPVRKSRGGEAAEGVHDGWDPLFIAQMRQRKKYDERILQAKPYAVGQYVWVFQNIIPPKGTKKLKK